MKRVLNEVTIEILQKCASSCIFCSSNSTVAAETKVSFDKICEIIDFCKAHGSKNINISGGEPLLHDQFIEIINYCVQSELDATVYTSGNVQPELWKQLFSSGIDHNRARFIFNYPSCDNDVYQRLIGTKDFHIETLDIAIKNLIKGSFEVEVHIVPNRINFGTLFDSAKHLKALGVKRISFLRLVPQGRAEVNIDQLRIDDAELQKEISRIQMNLVDAVFAIRGGVPFSRLLSNKCECNAGEKKLIFRYDGVVLPCEAFKEAPENNDFKLGSIHHTNLRDIWSNKEAFNCLKVLKQKANCMAEPCPAQMLYKRVPLK